MRFEPVNFGKTHITVEQLYLCNSFQFSSASCAITFSQDRQDTDAAARCNYLDLRNVTNDFEVHQQNYTSKMDDRSEPLEFAQICNAVGQIGNLSYEREAVLPNFLVLRHHQNFVKVRVDGGNEFDDDL